MSDIRYSIGIDPGWKNLGIALVKEEEGKLSLVSSKALNPSEFPSRNRPFSIITSFLSEALDRPISYFTMERYVSYQNVNTAEAENILMLIGEIKNHTETWMLQDGSDTILVRAIDWKTELVKTLVKTKGFNNPSTSLDKKFSIAAAHACLDVNADFKTDHEADATCLACLPFIRERLKPRTKTTFSND